MKDSQILDIIYFSGEITGKFGVQESHSIPMKLEFNGEIFILLKSNLMISPS
jgi:hypothetical protein